MTSKSAIALALLVAAAFGISGASAEDFYKNKQLRLIAGFPAGNDYDLGARLLVKYLPKYIPGQPTIIVQNMPQAASVAAANAVRNVLRILKRENSLTATFDHLLPLDDYYELVGLKAMLTREEGYDKAAEALTRKRAAE